MAIHMGKTSYIEIGGVDLSSFVKDVLEVEPQPWQERLLDGLPTVSITIDFRASLDYDAWWRAWDRAQAYWRERRRQQLSRMHAAYRRRRR
jgi:hypothetical protein